MESSDVFQTMQTQEIERILSEQKQSLEQWIDYLGDETALYDPALKYWVFRSVTGLQNFHKEKWKFEKRSKGTTAAFPELNREALAQTIDSMAKHLADAGVSFEDKILEDAVKRQNFGDIYAYFLTKSHIHTKNILYSKYLSNNYLS